MCQTRRVRVFSSRRAALLAASALCFGAASGGASAQDAPAESAVSEVIVTGSRVAVTGFAAPTPTQVLGGDVLDRQGATNVNAALKQNPAFVPSRNPGSNGTVVNSPGSALADLRGLGAQRTLVLVNGLRMAPEATSIPSGAPLASDLNLIPSLLVDRIEVVTGGASAQYGSDAIGGVVNLILKNRFEGIDLRAQYGISERGDNDGVRLGGLVGKSFADGRGHAVFGIDYETNDGVGDIYTRDWGRQEWMIVSNNAFATNGLPAQILSPHVHDNLSTGGLISGPANFSLRGFTFNPDGTTRRFDAGTLGNGTIQIGGEGRYQSAGVAMVPGVKRVATYSHIEYDVSDDLKVFGELSWSKAKGTLPHLLPRLTGSLITIRQDNAFLPAAVRAAMVAEGVQSFTLTRLATDIGNETFFATNEAPRGVIGVEGKFGDWSWDANVQHSQSLYNGTSHNNPVRERYGFASDAVVNPANGQIVCRATLPGASFNAAAAGCVPMNLFGVGAPSQAAVDWANDEGPQKAKYQQTTASFNLRGEPFELPAGPLSFATGGEYRKEKERVTSNAISAANGFLISGNSTPFSGKFDVYEGYAEVLAPLLKDAAWARSLDVNLAGRIAKYSTIGTQYAWKAGVSYAPIDGLRFRVTRSRDMRAPGIPDLYTQGAFITNSITLNGRNYFIPQRSQAGNPDLGPEKGDTLTVGVVIEPTGFLQGFRFSADYYDIKLKDAIAALSTQNVANLCTQGNAQFCGFFTYDAAGNPTSVTSYTLNLAQRRNTGIDFVASYSKPMDELFPGTPGRLSIDFGATWVMDAINEPGAGAAPIQLAGMTNTGGIPRVRTNASVTWSGEKGSITVQQLWISRSRQDNSWNSLPSLTINDNTVPAIVYYNLFGSWNVTERIELSAQIYNLLDKDPPPVPYAVLLQPTNGVWYDKVGRTFQVGVRYRY